MLRNDFRAADVGRTRTILVSEVGDVDSLPTIPGIKGISVAQRVGPRVLEFCSRRVFLITWQIRGKRQIEGGKDHHEDNTRVVAHGIELPQWP